MSIFCPECDQLILTEPTCPACGWERPRPAPVPGALDPEPLPLGSVLAGPPAVFDDAVWYAALPAGQIHSTSWKPIFDQARLEPL